MSLRNAAVADLNVLSLFYRIIVVLTVWIVFVVFLTGVAIIVGRDAARWTGAKVNGYRIGIRRKRLTA